MWIGERRGATESEAGWDCVELHSGVRDGGVGQGAIWMEEPSRNSRLTAVLVI